MRSRKLLPLLAVILCNTISAFSQTLPPQMADDQMGFQPFQSYHGGDIDHIGLANGTLNVDHLLLTYPQRGQLPFSFHLYYNNQPQHMGWECVRTGTNTQKCFFQWGYSPVTSPLPVEKGDVFVGWAEQVAFTSADSNVVLNAGKTDQVTYHYSNWSVQTADGVKHPLGNLGSNSWVLSGYDYYESSSGPFETLDATGIRVNGALVTDDFQGGAPSPTQIVGPDGILGGIEDANGNTIVATGAGYSSSSFVDTLGRQVPAFPTAKTPSNTDTSTCPAPPQVALAVDHAVLWSVPGPNGGTSNFKFCYASVAINMPPASYGAIPASYNQIKLQSIVLPDGHTWNFQYNDPGDGSTYNNAPINYGTLTQITLPTGGTISYTYTTTGTGSGGTSCQNSGRFVASRTVNANDGTGGHTWTYSYSTVSTGSTSSPWTVTTTVTDPLGNYTVHTFNALYAQDYCPAYESQTQYFQNGGTLLKTVNTTFSFSQGDNKSGPMNVVPIQITTVLPNGLTSTVTKSYDSGFTYTSFKGATGMPGSYGRLLSESASDYGSSAAGPTLRTTKNSYLALSNSNYLDANLLGLVSSKSVVDGSNCKQAETDYTYDESSYLTTYAGTLPSGSHNSPPNSVRGNLTTATRQLFSAGTCPTSAQSGPTTHTNWYDTGEIYQAIDAMGNATTHSYDSAYAGAFSTKTCNALSQCVSGTYDANTGLLTSFTDQNGSSQASGTTQGDPNHTSNFSYDSMWRMIQALSPPDPTGARPETDLNYPDATTVQHCKKQNSNSGSTCGTGWIVSYAYFDGVGRKKQTRLVDPAGDDFVDTTYAADGRASTVSNPHRSASSATDGTTTTQYDGLSRVTQVTKQDGSISSVQYDLAAGTTNCTLSTDEAGKQRKTCSDGLGRLTRVFEDPAGLNYETDYQYDTLGNLLQVNQKGSAPGDSTQWRTRTFTYDSLSRLLTTNNPESGQISYAYDANGNVLSKSDARGTSFSYEYDVLNRLRFSTPSDGTPIVEYVYDQTSLSGYAISNGIGRMTTEYTFPAWGQQYIQAALFNYDALGHMTTELDCLPSTCPSSLGLTISATYDLVGEMTSLSYPDGQKVNYTYDTAEHALSAIGADNTNYTYNATYWPNGAQYRQWWSPNIYGRTDLNNRLQVAAFYSDNGVTPSYYLSKSYSYSTQNNGNVLEIYNNKDTTRNQSFTYDSLNRLTHAENGGTDCTQVLGDGHTEYWGNNYVYDAWGNLYQKNVTKCSAENMQATVTAQNRFTGSSYSYDANGNLLYDGLHHYTYDGENRITQVDSGATSYLYDADGSRVKKTSANLSATEYVDFGGNVIAERSTIALSASMLSQSGLSGYNPGQITDGSTACCGWHTDTATAGAWLQVDLGAGNQTAVTQASIYPASAAYTGNTPGNYSVQYSDDASTWSTAATNFVPSQAGWNSIIWASVGVHRYWRLYLTNTPGTGPWLNELQLVGETNYIFFNGKRVARHDPSGAVHYYLSDHLGSTTMVVSAAGAIENESDYYPWGGELKISAADAANHYKFTGKERDPESGLDYFGSRYYGNALGRFTTSDPIHFQASMPGDPQRFNLYAYVRNNPLAFIDPKGEAIELTGNDEERAKQLQAWRDLVGGGAAGQYLYDNTYTDSNGKTGHYVGIYTNGPDGKGPDFASISGLTKAMSDIVKDPQIGQLDFKSAGSTVRDDRIGVTFTMGPLDQHKALQTPGVVTFSSEDHKFHFNILNNDPYGTLPAAYMSDNKPGVLNQQILMGHEALGHGFLSPGSFSDSRAVNLENQVRQSKDPNAAYRLFHDPLPYQF